MKNAFLILSFLFTINCFSQNEYSYYVYLSNYMNAPEFKQIESEVIYIGEDSKMKSLFNKYKILRFYQAFPNILDDKILNVYKLKTTSKELINEMISEFPSLFLSYDDLTGNYLRFLDYYPDDFGSTSPVTNLGAPVSKKDLDYINAPMAWNITMGDSNIILGISDSGIDATLQDLQHKTSFVQGYNGSGQHGTNVAAIAAAQGDNAHGTVGVCSDCSLLANRYLYGSTSDIIYNRLYQLANEGAKVINMSWTNSGYISSSSGYIQVEQDIINYIVDNFGVVFVAAAGNRSSFSSPEVHHVNNNGSPDTPFGTLFVYPATYENVISVGSVNFLHSEINSNSFVVMSPLSFPIHMYIEDSVSPQVDGTDVNNPIGIINNGFHTSSSPNGLIWMDTVNEEIDIMAPSYTIFEYYDYEHESSNGYYSGGTSYAAPAVTGAIGLMLSVNDCISVNDIETILPLTSKDIEHNLNSEDIEPSTLNEVFYGKIGSGKLEAGNAVTFV
ncbi:MAG TPA: hypothetical protein DHV22_03275, partial [Xanthomarina gelatinilytica]|nr:hypothetical protein [Xanthomarina gelatinilytica]